MDGASLASGFVRNRRFGSYFDAGSILDCDGPRKAVSNKEELGQKKRAVDDWVTVLISWIRILICFVVMMFTTFIWAVIMLLLLPWPYQRIRQGNIYGHVTGRLMMWILGNPITIEGAEYSEETAIYISNHASPIDIFLIMWLTPTGTVGIAKKEVLQNTSERQILNHFAEMNQTVQGESSSAPVVLPLKRRRGRPRKDPSLKRVVRAQVPPRFELVQEIQPQQENRNAVNDGMIGQAVTGVVEAAFDAGYLLNVRIGDSHTNYRGVVFKPGHYVPITAANDIAPHVQMIRRNEVPPPAENQLQVYGHRTERNGSLNLASRSSKNKQVVMHPSVPPVGARGTVVPVVLQPVNLTNGPASSQYPASQASNRESSREREVQMVKPLAMLPPEGPVTPGQLPPEPTHGTLPSQTQVSNEVAIGTGQKEDGSLSKGTEVVQGEEVKPVVSTNVTIPIAVAEESQGSGLFPKKDTGNDEGSHKLSAEYSPEQDTCEMNQVPSAEPGKLANPTLHTQATSASKPLMNYGTGRMTELLQAVQENLMENQLLRAGESGLGVMKGPKTDGNKEETSVQ